MLHCCSYEVDNNETLALPAPAVVHAHGMPPALSLFISRQSATQQAQPCPPACSATISMSAGDTCLLLAPSWLRHLSAAMLAPACAGQPPQMLQ